MSIEPPSTKNSAPSTKQTRVIAAPMSPFKLVIGIVLPQGGNKGKKFLRFRDRMCIRSVSQTQRDQDREVPHVLSPAKHHDRV